MLVAAKGRIELNVFLNLGLLLGLMDCLDARVVGIVC
jgi:hypothetical protein